MPAIKLKIAGLLLLLVALNSQAFTLGRMRGAALVGQALDLSIQVQADAGETPGVQCFEVDVFYADTRQDASRVSCRSSRRRHKITTFAFSPAPWSTNPW